MPRTHLEIEIEVAAAQEGHAQPQIVRILRGGAEMSRDTQRVALHDDAPGTHAPS